MGVQLFISFVNTLSRIYFETQHLREEAHIEQQLGPFLNKCSEQWHDMTSALMYSRRPVSLRLEERGARRQSFHSPSRCMSWF